MAESNRSVTEILHACQNGEAGSVEQLFPLIYEELRELAARRLRQERPGHTLAPTALVHEAYLRLVGTEIPWQDRRHFFAVAALTMRRVLVDHARQRSRGKRGGAGAKLSLDEAIYVAEEPDPRILLLDEALTKLAGIDERKAKLVELLYFGGLTFEEATAVLDVSVATLHREMKFAKAWIANELRSAGEQA